MDNLPADNTEMKTWRTSETHPIRVDFVQIEEFPFLQNLGMTFAPGKKQPDAITGVWHRDLALDIQQLVDFYKVETLVSLIEDHELIALQIAELPEECIRQNLELIRYPIKDGSVPLSIQDYSFLIAEIIKRLETGKKVVVHCKGGLGRAGLTAACTIVALTNLTINPLDVIKVVRKARIGAIETEEQARWVSMFSEYWQKNL